MNYYIIERFDPDHVFGQSRACFSHWGKAELDLLASTKYYELKWSLIEGDFSTSISKEELIKVAEAFFPKWQEIWGEDLVHWKITDDAIHHWCDGVNINSFHHMYAVFAAFRVFGEHGSIGRTFLYFAKKYPKLNALQLLYLSHIYRLKGTYYNYWLDEEEQEKRKHQHDTQLPFGHEYIPQINLLDGKYSIDYFKDAQSHVKRITDMSTRNKSPITSRIWPVSKEKIKPLTVQSTDKFKGLLNESR